MPQPLVEAYSFGRLKLGGRVYERDLIVTPSRILSDWWRREGHLLTLEDLADVAETEKIDSVVIGTGYSGAMEVLDEVLEHFRRKSVEVYVANTRKAVEIYNELVKAGRRVLGAFHLTC
ncbi:MAG: Mth938-like domain-containing protein [Thermofilaceae archaeon]